MNFEGKSLTDSGWDLLMGAERVDGTDSIQVTIGFGPVPGFRSFLLRLAWLFWMRGDRAVRISMTVTPTGGQSTTTPGKKVFPS